MLRHPELEQQGIAHIDLDLLGFCCQLFAEAGITDHTKDVFDPGAVAFRPSAVESFVLTDLKEMVQSLFVAEHALHDHLCRISGRVVREHLCFKVRLESTEVTTDFFELSLQYNMLWGCTLATGRLSRSND